MYRSVVVGTGFKLSGNKSLRQTTGNLKTKLKKLTAKKQSTKNTKPSATPKKENNDVDEDNDNDNNKKRKQIFSSSSCG